MKKLTTALIFIISTASIANENYLGRFEGLTIDQRKCHIEIYKIDEGDEGSSKDIVMNTSFAESFWQSDKTFDFQTSEVAFSEDFELGYIDSVNIKENSAINYYHEESLGIPLDEDKNFTEFSVTVKDERIYYQEKTVKYKCVGVTRVDVE